MLDWLKSRLRAAGPDDASLLRQAEDALRLGAPAQAREICLGVLQRSPRDVQALSLMAAMAADAKQIEEGLQWAKSALAADPGAAAPHYAIGRLWELAGEPAKAEASYRQVTRLEPGHAKAHNNLGCVLSLAGKFDEALACFRQALVLDPQQPEANQNYAALANDAEAQEFAIQGYLRQTEVDPTDARAFCNLASVYSGLGRNQEAMACLDRALTVDPGRAIAHYSRAVLLLAAGDYARGWEEYEWRWRLDNWLSAPARRFEQPIWDGRDIGDGALLMHGELALGEPLQFARYARLAAERCASVIIECAPRVKSLLQGVAGVAKVIAPGEPLPPFAAHVPLHSLPRVFGTTLQNIPWEGPYIKPDPERAARWRSLIESTGESRLKVGVVWSGNPQNPYNRDRSVPFDALAPLQAVPGVAFYSLQSGEAAKASSLRHAALKLIDLSAHERDLQDTAAFISQLDLVVTVDTMISALAGAMGTQVWVMLNRVPDWRHHLERSDNPWYPSMRLYRQERPGDWTGVVEQVAADLRSTPV
ncbi:MAG: tetratricopeptide repeat protein [Betaproteobacteria bacterium]